MPYVGIPLGTSSALPYGTDSDGLGAIFLGAIFKMAEVNRATRGCMHCCLCNRYHCVLFRRFCLPGKFSFENTIQKHDANSCTNSLLDRIGFTTAPSHFTDIRVQKGAYSTEPSSRMAETAEVYGSGRGCSEWLASKRAGGKY